MSNQPQKFYWVTAREITLADRVFTEREHRFDMNNIDDKCSKKCENAKILGYNYKQKSLKRTLNDACLGGGRDTARALRTHGDRDARSRSSIIAGKAHQVQSRTASITFRYTARHTRCAGNVMSIPQLDPQKKFFFMNWLFFIFSLKNII